MNARSQDTVVGCVEYHEDECSYIILRSNGYALADTDNRVRMGDDCKLRSSADAAHGHAR